MLKGFLKAYRPPKVSNEMKCTNEKQCENKILKHACPVDYKVMNNLSR